MPRRSYLDVIKDYFPGKWKWLRGAKYWTGMVHTSREVPERLLKVYLMKNPLACELYRETWILTCGTHRVEAHNLHDACAKMHKALYSV